MNFRTSTILFSALLAVAGGVSAAGVVDVKFIESVRYTDAGPSPWEREANLKVLDTTLQQLGQRYLRNGDVLKIDVLDIDLAGNVKPFPRGAEDKRIIRGNADWPRIQLRYTLQRDGKPLFSRTELVSDLDYTGGLSRIRSPESLEYEKKMLEKWFKSSFSEGRSAG